MNKIIKLILLGLLIWVIPFFVSIFIWDPVAQAPSIAMSWFNAFMALSWSIGIVIALSIYFKGDHKDYAKAGITAGITWYLSLLILDLIILVGLLGMPLEDWYPMILTYLNTAIITITVGYILCRK